MKEKRFWIILTTVALLVGAGAGTMIYLEYGKIDVARAEIATLGSEIADARTLLKGTGDLEREVIVLRETEEKIKEILPDEQDINNFVRELRKFEEQSEVRITGLKRKPKEVSRNEASDFDKVAYQLTFEADAFQLLGFLDRIEGHSRFMRVPMFKLGAATRRQVEEKGVAAHKIQMDVETYVYQQADGPAQIKIENYDRKRELLLGETIRRQQNLHIDTYTYRGPRGRRDPWVDPRVPVLEDDEIGLPVQEQAEIVEGLVVATQEVSGLWADVRDADNVIVEMTQRAELEQKLALVEENLRRTIDEGVIRFVQYERRMQLEVIDPLTSIRVEMGEGRGGRGPTADALRELLDTMTRHLNSGEHAMALVAYSSVEGRLEMALRDPVRMSLVEALEQRAEEARILLDFEKLDIAIDGVGIREGQPPIVLVNGKALGEGDLVNPELVITGIRSGEIEFMFRGVVLIRRF